MSRSRVKAGEGYVELGIKSRIAQGMKRASQELKSKGAALAKVGAAITAASGSVLAGFGAATSNFAAFGDELDKMSGRTGIGVRALQELRFAAELSGASLTNVEQAVLKMNRRVGRITAGEGTDSQTKAIEALGLSIQNLARMNPEERFLAIGNAIASYGDDAAAAGLAQRAFGTSVDKLLPLFKAGADGIAAMREEARQLGIIIPPEATTSAAKLTDAMHKLKVVLKAAAVSIGSALAPVVTRLANEFTRLAGPVLEFVRNNERLVQILAASAIALTGFGVALTVAGGAMIFAGTAASAVTTAFAALSAVTLPIIAAIAGVTAVVGVLSYAWLKAAYQTGLLSAQLEVLRKLFFRILEVGKKTFGGIAAAITASDWGGAMQILWAGVKTAFFAGIEEIVAAWERLWPLMWETAKAFFANLVTLAGKGIKAVVSILSNPAMAGFKINDFIQGLSDSGVDVGNESGLAGWARGHRKAAEKELDKLVSAAEKKAAAVRAATAAAVNDSTGGPENTAPAPPLPDIEAPPEMESAFDSKKKELELQLVEMTKGSEAADKLRLAEEGLTEAEIRQVMALKSKIKAIEEAKKKQQEQRDAAEQAAREEKLKEQQERRRKKQQQAARIEALKNRGKQLAESLRTPREEMEDELKEVKSLHRQGFIDDETATRARARAMKEFAEATKEKEPGRLNESIQQNQPNGPTGTFNAFAAQAIGQGRQNFEKEQTQLQRVMAEKLTVIAKRKPKAALG